MNFISAEKPSYIIERMEDCIINESTVLKRYLIKWIGGDKFGQTEWVTKLP